MDKFKFDTVVIGRGFIGLAIHLTLDLSRKARFGPNVSDCDATDCIIETEKEHGLDGAVNILNGESSGLTASLALAEYV